MKERIETKALNSFITGRYPIDVCQNELQTQFNFQNKLSSTKMLICKDGTRKINFGDPSSKNGKLINWGERIPPNKLVFIIITISCRLPHKNKNKINST